LTEPTIHRLIEAIQPRWVVLCGHVVVPRVDQLPDVMEAIDESTLGHCWRRHISEHEHRRNLLEAMSHHEFIQTKGGPQKHADGRCRPPLVTFLYPLRAGHKEMASEPFIKLRDRQSLGHKNVCGGEDNVADVLFRHRHPEQFKLRLRRSFVPPMIDPTALAVWHLINPARAEHWLIVAIHCRGRLGCGNGFIGEGFIVIVHLNPLGPKLLNFLVTAKHIKDHVAIVCAVGVSNNLTPWIRRGLLYLTFERYHGAHVNPEVVFDDVAFAINVGDGNEVAHLLPPCDQPHPLASDDDARQARTRVRGVLLSNPVARVKETGASRANGSNFAKLLRRHHRPV
jgi:hypothetical protein